MKIAMQVCSLEQAKKLEKLGVPQDEAHFMWFEVSNGDDEGDFEKEGVEWHPILTQQDYERGEHRAMGVIDSELTTSEGEFCSYKPNECKAFTVAELGELLVIDDGDHFCYGYYDEHGGTWNVDLQKRDEELEVPFKLVYQVEGETEAEARADMLIYLIENKIITMESINSPIENKGK